MRKRHSVSAHYILKLLIVKILLGYFDTRMYSSNRAVELRTMRCWICIVQADWVTLSSLYLCNVTQRNYLFNWCLFIGLCIFIAPSPFNYIFIPHCRTASRWSNCDVSYRDHIYIYPDTEIDNRDTVRASHRLLQILSVLIMPLGSIVRLVCEGFSTQS